MHFRSQSKYQGDVSLSDSIDSDREGNALSLMDVISVEDDMLENLDARDSCAKVRRCVEHCLTEREAKVISLRYGLDGEGPRTQREIASSCGISRSYVSQRCYCKRFCLQRNAPLTAQSLATARVIPSAPVPGTGSGG